jgi:FkbM family methyltransferase
MKNVRGIWLPDHEEHLVRYASKDNWSYQLEKLEACMPWVTEWDTAIDVGGHCGLWSMHLTKKFSRVYAFEPIPDHRDCFVLNAPDAELVPVALGEKEGVVKLKTKPSSSGDTRIMKDGNVTADMKTLDSFGIRNVGFIKIDTEGYELNVLKGAEETIKKWHPVVIVEQKPGKAQEYGFQETEAKEWLKARGYKLRKVMSGDFILS